MTFAIKLYPAAKWDEEAETHVLGEPSETVATIDAGYPAAARSCGPSTRLRARSGPAS